MDALLKEDVKFNCDVSDAQFWGYFSICGLLMRYRDLFRSERMLQPWEPLGRDEIAAWIQAKEARWPGLEREEFRELRLGNDRFPPFAVPAINEALRTEGLLYGAGYGMYMKPTFFLADLEQTDTQEGHRIRTAGREHVRDLFTTAGMLQDEEIFIRLEPLSVLLWEKLQEARSRPGSALAAAFIGWGIRDLSAPYAEVRPLFDPLVRHYAAVLTRHEIGEARESSPEWKGLLAASLDRDAEHFLRAVKDLIADTSDRGTIAFLAANEDRVGLDLFLGMLDGYRRSLFPELKQASERLSEEGWQAVETARTAGRRRFLAVRDEVLALHRGSSGDAGSFRGAVRRLIIANRERE